MHGGNIQGKIPLWGQLCLGVSLGRRFVGLALASREYLVVDRVINLHKIPSADGKERRFVQVVENCLDAYQVTGIAVALPSGRQEGFEEVKSQDLWLKEEAARRGIPCQAYDGAFITRTTLQATSGKPSLRRLASHLALSFPELIHKTPESIPIPGVALAPELAERPRKVRPDRERYWARMFLALAAAQLHLEKQMLTNEPL